jgi:hypothetical protein
MGWLAVVWGPEMDAVDATSGWVRRRLDDQGPYARGEPFDLAVGGSGPAPATEWPTLGARVLAWTVEDWAVLEAATAPSVAMVSLMRRNPVMTHDEFVTYWRRRHAPLALRRHVGLVDYHQCVVQEPLMVDCEGQRVPEIDGVAVLGFATREDFETRFFDSELGRAEIMEDVARFMDGPGPETTLVGPPD